MHKVILDTDIGTNPDDAIALSLIMKSPEIKLEGVTTVYGNVNLRTQIAKKILYLCGEEDIKVYSGIERPLLQKRSIQWAGIEGKDLNLPKPYAEESKHAVNFIIKTILENPGKITLITIGPLTNIAAALILEPKIADHVKEIILMGGSTRLTENALEISPFEHNINCDPEAAEIVLSSGIKTTMVGLDITRQIKISRETNEQLMKSGDPLIHVLGKMINTHMQYMKRDYSYLSDPIAVAVLIDHSIVGKQPMDITLRYDKNKAAITVGRLNKKSNIDVCLSIRQEDFLKLINDRVFLIKDIDL